VKVYAIKQVLAKDGTRLYQVLDEEDRLISQHRNHRVASATRSIMMRIQEGKEETK